MKQGYRSCFVAFVAALFSVISWVSHAQIEPTNVSDLAQVEQHAPYFDVNNSPHYLNQFNYLLVHGPNLNLCITHSPWFQNRFCSMAIMSVDYWQKVNRWYKHQCNTLLRMTSLNCWLMCLKLFFHSDLATSLSLNLN